MPQTEQRPIRLDAAAHGSGDAASTGGLAGAVGALLPALEAFQRFDTPERTGIDRAVWAARLEEPLPRSGQGAEAVLEALRDVVIPNGLRAGAPGFSGWVATAPTTLPAAAHLAAAVAGPLAVGLQAFNLLEALATRWLGELLGLPPTHQGLLTSGGTVANLIGLGAARQHAWELRGLDPSRDGLEGVPKPRIYASTEVHHCIYRAAGVLGLGRRAVAAVPVGDDLRMDLHALRRQLEADLAAGCTPVAVVANAGTIGAGTVDPLPELAALCREYGVWLHVDGAYGLLGVLDPEVAPLYGDLGECDSLVADPHKWLATSMGIGCVFVRDAGIMERAFTLEPAVYVEGSQPMRPPPPDAPVTSQFDGFGYAFHHLGVEHSLPSRGVEVWAVLKEIGAEGVRERVRRHCGFARYLAERVRRSPELELMAPVTLSTCCFRYVPAALRGRTDPEAVAALNGLNREVLGRVRARGRCIPSATSIGEAFVIRPCFINPRTTPGDVDALADDVESCGSEAWAALGGGDG
ncbi:MAG TPA: aminotransferase class V-fold PLP-dependent enzyme [Longimicrobiaceae bacterium]|nr:aminotransferase class V-fold PLP-dependent enzyme [Longimicrobiaceae bacterium]